MPASDFPHLEILAIERGEARLEGGGDTSELVRENKANRRRHAYSLSGSLQRLTEFARHTQRYRADENLPEIREGVPFVLQVSESDEELLFFLSDKLGVEVVAEDEEGFILVASKDIEAKSFQQVIEEFVQKKRGSARAANVLQVIPESDSEQRLKRILPENLLEQWPFQDDQIYTLEISIKSATAEKLPTLRRRRNNENIRKYNARAAEWRSRVEQLMAEVEDERIDRESVIEEFVAAYQGEFLTGFVDNDREHSQFAELSDSFSTRIRMSGRGFKDLILNFPYVFEATLPDEFEQPGLENGEPAEEGADLRPPAADAPAVCIVDSGIQEGHIFLAAAIDSPQSRCFLPGVDPADVADYVGNGGHGTRVAGVALYGGSNPLSGMDAAFWLQNARFLDDQGWIPIAVFPPLALREIVAHFRHGPRQTRIFNHSVAGTRACWRRRMSTWAAEIDRLSEAEDVLFIQAIGNVEANGFGGNNPTIADHLSAGRAYPDYLREPSAMLANPAQSLQAITVGSLALGQFANGDLSSLAQGVADPSGFSRTGLGLWGSVKPDVVELGGDYVRNQAARPQLSYPQEVCPLLVRSTMNAAGPAIARDCIGTSFSAPKVSHIAGRLAAELPNEPTLLYRALIAQSARWPDWAEQSPVNDKLNCLRHIGYGLPDLERATQNEEFRVTLITRGVHQIRAREALIFAIPIPEELRRPGLDANIRLEITLSYAAEPRRTRSSRRGYLAVWVDWICSHIDESFEAFRRRALKTDTEPTEQTPIRWTLDRRSHWGEVRGAARGGGTLQKDWTTIKSFNLPDMLAVAVRGHPGWNHRNREATAAFSLAVTLEAMDRDVPVYIPIRQAIEIHAGEIRVPIEV